MAIGFTIIILVLVGITSYLAVKFHEADKKAEEAVRISAYFAPITIDSAKAMLERKGYTVEKIDTEDMSIIFSMNGTRFSLDMNYKPLIFLQLGFAVKDIDNDALKAAGETVTEKIAMVKVGVHDGGFTYMLGSHENCIGHLEASIDRYLDIISDAQSLMSETYHQLISEEMNSERPQNDPVSSVESRISQASKIPS